MGSIAARSGTWDEASSPAATRLARRFEDAWRASAPRRRPDPLQYLPDGPEGSAPAARLALLRADLNLRWDDGEAVRVESYRDRLPGLDAETLVALCYEEFCRREEDGEGPFAAEYDERFPELADRLRRVFDIHELVGNAASTDLHVPSPEAVPFPEAGQTIAGFHLVEELGRGSFARVFLARERQLADRPVALKVARTGSREPQTLARLQHTHIVPVHSYRDDPATGLHLLCMPYFGRVTLSGLLADPLARVAPTGAEILAALDRLDPDEARASSARNALARLPFGRAIAWWGARLAEALAHAHDRGILHRDIKPSNVLITGDALPMLLDFNLAVATRADEDDETLGGTLAYMAPEHLEAVARREEGRIDRRSDVYSLGVLLFEALTGERPFPPSSAGATSMPEVLRRAAEDRRVEPPRLRLTHPEVPAALERVIRRCLRPDPADRFRSAADLALDLQAVADDAPLRSTREPITVRLVRRGRRSWKKLALLVPAVAAAAALAMSAVRDGQERVKAEADASQMLRQGRASLRLENYADASARFEAVERLTVDRPELAGLRRQARVHAASAREAGRFREKADALARSAAELRPRLASPSPGPGDLAAFEAALAPFRILTDPAWSASPDLTFLDAPRKARLLRDADELMFLHAASLNPDDRRAARRGIELCDRALAFTTAPAPWKALRARFDESPAPEVGDDPRPETSPLAAFEWGVVRDRQGRMNSAAAWLDRATDLDPGNPWYHRQAAAAHARADHAHDALRQIEAAVALDPKSAPILRERAQIRRSLGDWARADDDDERAKATGH